MVNDDAVQNRHEGGLEEAVNDVEPYDEQEEDGAQHGEEDRPDGGGHQYGDPVLTKPVPC